MQEIVISFVAAVARRFMHDRHADLYLGRVSVGRPRTSYNILLNFA
jgi:hypothetical protein